MTMKHYIVDEISTDEIDDKIVDLKNITSGGGQENQNEKIAEKDKDIAASDDAAMKIGNSCLVEVKLTGYCYDTEKALYSVIYVHLDAIFN